MAPDRRLAMKRYGVAGGARRGARTAACGARNAGWKPLEGMPIFRDEDRAPASPAEVTADLSYELVRACVAVARLLGEDLGQPTWSPDDVEAELLRRLERRLHDFVLVFGTEDVADSLLLLAEAVDNLKAGDALDVADLARLWRRVAG